MYAIILFKFHSKLVHYLSSCVCIMQIVLLLNTLEITTNDILLIM